MMTRIIILLAVFFGLILYLKPVQAESVVYQDERMTVTLSTDTCTNPAVLGHIKGEFQATFRAGIVIWQGKLFNLCWALIEDEVLIVDETGDSGFMPVKGFKRAKVI